jgi:hypothetical protein
LHKQFKYITNSSKTTVPSIRTYDTNIKEILKIAEETVAKEVLIAHYVLLSKNKTLANRFENTLNEGLYKLIM